MNDLYRVKSKIKINSDGCFVWQGLLSIAGYGICWVNGKKMFTHRFMYEHYKQKIPKGLVINHLCRNRACCNPKHLEAVTNRTNALKGIGFGAINFNKTHCYRGHEFTKSNTLVTKETWRQCVICLKIKNDNRDKEEKRIKQIKIRKISRNNELFNKRNALYVRRAYRRMLGRTEEVKELDKEIKEINKIYKK